LIIARVTAWQLEHGQLSAVFVTLLGFGIGVYGRCLGVFGGYWGLFGGYCVLATEYGRMPVGVIGGYYFANFATAFQFEHGQLSAVFVTLLGFGNGGRSYAWGLFEGVLLNWGHWSLDYWTVVVSYHQH